MRHGSLFSGIGGWNIASDEMGWETVFNCEIDPFGQRVLKYYWPKAKLYGDIKKTDFSKWRGKIDIITNSFPCQGFSVAGKRKGTEDNRYLWPESLRAIKEIQPTWVVSENVHGIINIEKGMVFEQVHTDLEAAGYEVFTYVLPACAVNAPHRRDRVWFVAYNSNARIKGMRKEKDEVYESSITSNTTNTNKQRHGICKEQQERTTGRSGSGVNKSGITANTKSEGRKGSNIIEKSIRFKPGTWDNWPTTEPTIRGRDDGIFSRLDGITFSRWRNESIKGFGNAIVPQIAFQLFKAIESIHEKESNEDDNNSINHNPFYSDFTGS